MVAPWQWVSDEHTVHGVHPSHEGKTDLFCRAILGLHRPGCHQAFGGGIYPIYKHHAFCAPHCRSPVTLEVIHLESKPIQSCAKELADAW